MPQTNNNKKSLKDKFLEIANPDKDGFSREVTIDELINIDRNFSTGNGGSWCRDDGPLKEYNIVRKKRSNKICSVKLDGFNKNKKLRQINKKIRDEIIKMPCVVLAINSGIECDHKDGKYDDENVSDTEKQKIDDFQPLSRNVNLAKRQHCKKCIETGIRFDAKRLGYASSYTKGDEKTKSCVGCYWYDPKDFNEIMSKEFKTDK